MRYIGGGSGVVSSTTSGTLDNNFFQVTLGTNTSPLGYKTLKVTAGVGALQTDGTISEKVAGLTTNNDSIQEAKSCIFDYPLTDNIVIDGEDTTTTGTVYVGFVPISNPLEEGLCNIVSSGQVTMTASSVAKLRDITFCNPSKIRFYLADGTAATNNQIYEVQSIIDSTTIQLLPNNITAESDVKLLIVGTYDLSSAGSLTDKYTYPTITGDLVFDTTLTDITSNGGFVIAKLDYSALDTFTITDLRTSYLLNLGKELPTNIVYTDTTQTITGDKTFSGANDFSGTVSFSNFPLFSSPFYNIQNSTAISLTTGANALIITATSTNSMFLIKAVSTSELTTLALTAGSGVGCHLYLRIDPTGTDLLMNLGTTSGCINDNSFRVRQVLCKKGSILDLIKQSNGTWLILNPFDLQDVKSTGTLATNVWTKIPNSIIRNHVGTQAYSNNVFYIKAINGVIYINVESFYVASLEGNSVTVDLIANYPHLFVGYDNRVSVNTHNYNDGYDHSHWLGYDASTYLFSANTNVFDELHTIGQTLIIA
jgi:hypothetical protein